MTPSDFTSAGVNCVAFVLALLMKRRDKCGRDILMRLEKMCEMIEELIQIWQFEVVVVKVHFTWIAEVDLRNAHVFGASPIELPL